MENRTIYCIVCGNVGTRKMPKGFPAHPVSKMCPTVCGFCAHYICKTELYQQAIEKGFNNAGQTRPEGSKDVK